MARGGEVLAATQVLPQGELKRVYPGGEAFASLTGFVSSRYGKSGGEAVFNQALSGLNPLNKFLRLTGGEIRGEDVVLTVDFKLQQLAFRLLGGRKGAVVALDPRSGEILALVSSPSYDPNQVEVNWAGLMADPAKPLFNRALQGTYPPGSCFKIVTGAAVLEKDVGYAARSLLCPGQVKIEGYELSCPRAHGKIGFKEAFAYSCNVFFATLAQTVGAQKLRKVAEAFGFNEEIPCELAVKESLFPARLSAPDLAACAIGQGKVLATPFHLALIAAAVAQDGLMMKPHLLKEVRTPEGKVKTQQVPVLWREVTSPAVTAKLKEALAAVVTEGTGQAAQVPGLALAGKTGSAENPQGPPHAWFVGFGPLPEPRLAVAVIIEHGGAGGVASAPVAKALFEAYLLRS